MSGSLAPLGAAGLYVVATLAVHTALRAWIRRQAPQVDGRPVFPETPNAYEVAFLRDGVNGVVQTAVVSLLERRLLQETPRGVRRRHVQMLRTSTPNEDLPEQHLERVILAAAFRPLSRWMLSDRLFLARMKDLCCNYEERLIQRGYMAGSPLPGQCRWGAGIAATLLLAAAGTLWMWSHPHGGGVGVSLYAPLVLVSLLSLASTVHWDRGPWTREGRDFLRQRREAITTGTTTPDMLVAAVGIRALRGTPWSDWRQFFNRFSLPPMLWFAERFLLPQTLHGFDAAGWGDPFANPFEMDSDAGGHFGSCAPDGGDCVGEG